ncbi:hypothetical protein KRR39_05895 [Nocardioides panacis]|uniref:Uncharacterized protein n=1 Tax=Nocardioides panacis TaxID=2849501 RepID=A0A975T0M5_9ACTN|nr:hypothetical protein [Nocardioides panacis]QWZ09316.1 hypothetical protein KRR39_05895 [Nocardioides panacis]
MNESFWREQLERAARAEAGPEVDVRADVARGRVRLRQRRVAVGGAALLVAGVVLGGGLALGAGGSGQAGPVPVGPGPTATATYHEPDVTIEPSASPATATATASGDARTARLRATLEQDWSSPEDIPFKAWRSELFATTRSVLDPSGTHLDYASAGLTAGYDDQGVGLGVKLGWSRPGSPGLGLVEVEVSNEGGSDQDQCVSLGGFGCPRTVDVGGTTMRVGEGDAGEFVVLHRRPDGVRVLVLVNPLFGNNSTTPVAGIGVGPRDAYRLVQDDRLDLPE